MPDGRDGRLLKLGDTLKRPQLAETYKKIASKGADVFYTYVSNIFKCFNLLSMNNLKE